jgi:ubiquinone/menaquinone biosynthesis C-methylase UbiE
MNKIQVNTEELYKFNKKFSIYHYLGGLDYTRCFESPLAINNLNIEPKMLVLDIGSGWYNPVPIYLASKGCIVYATDIDNDIFKQVNYANNVGIGHLIGSSFIVEKQDARSLTYPDNHFDGILAISVLEHIEERGDILVMKEIKRCLKKRGRTVVTLPYSSCFQENQRSFNVDYFERRYDMDSIYKRIINPSNLKVEKIEFFGEKIKFSEIWYRIPKYLRFGMFSLFFSKMFHKLFVTEEDIQKYADKGVVVLTLSKIKEKP